MENIKKTSNEWYSELQLRMEGFTLSNTTDTSFYTERITEQEFINRILQSKVKFR